jgi:hypothetical protein
VTALPRWIPHLIGALGALILLRALVGFTTWGRTDGKRTRIYAGGFILALLLLGLLPSGVRALAAIPGIPWIWTAKWRKDAGAVKLALIGLTGVVTVFVSPIAFGADVALRERLQCPAGSLGARGRMDSFTGRS